MTFTSINMYHRHFYHETAMFVQRVMFIEKTVIEVFSNKTVFMLKLVDKPMNESFSLKKR